VLLLALGILALFTDERYDILQALSIVRGQDLPLTNDPPPIGPTCTVRVTPIIYIIQRRSKNEKESLDLAQGLESRI
jgi:hypothetical protein